MTSDSTPLPLLTEDRVRAVGARMAADWDRRAQEDARNYIACGESEGLHFSLAGLRDSLLVLEQLHPYLRADTRVLEIGCGIGRMLQFMAVLFDEVHGTDVSTEMIVQGRAFLARFPNAHLTRGDGHSLGQYEDASFGLVYSYVTFQHIPDKEVIRRYVGEARRILQPGGVFKYHVKTGQYLNSEGCDTWFGAILDERDIRGWHDEFGFELVNAYDEARGTAWVIARVPE